MQHHRQHDTLFCFNDTPIQNSNSLHEGVRRESQHGQRMKDLTPILPLHNITFRVQTSCMSVGKDHGGLHHHHEDHNTIETCYWYLFSYKIYVSFYTHEVLSPMYLSWVVFDIASMETWLGGVRVACVQSVVQTRVSFQWSAIFNLFSYTTIHICTYQYYSYSENWMSWNILLKLRRYTFWFRIFDMLYSWDHKPKKDHVWSTMTETSWESYWLHWTE